MTVQINPTAINAGMRPSSSGTVVPALLDAKQVAAFVNLSVSTLSRLVIKGGFPSPVEIGRAKRWRRSDVESWVASLPVGAG